MLGRDVWLAAAVHAGGGFILALVTGLIALPLLRRFQVHQHAYEDAPQSHQAKTGTPTIFPTPTTWPFWTPCRL